MAQDFYLLVVLACPIAMGLMMWMMMRGGKSERPHSGRDQDIADLRAEVDQLRAAQKPEQRQ